MGNPLSSVWQRHWCLILIVAALVTLLIWLVVVVETRTDKLTDDVWSVELVGRCYLDYHTPIHAVALACPGVDYIRLWPLPIEQPWPDPTDKPEPWPGWYAMEPADRLVLDGRPALRTVQPASNRVDRPLSHFVI